MKKTTLFMTSLLLATTIFSCNKDGVYNPKEKIDKIYVDAGSGKYLSEDWTWDNKQLKTIYYYDSAGTMNYTEAFTYDNNRLSQVDNHEAGESVKYTYDNRHLQQASFYKNNVLYMSCFFDYDGNKLADIKVSMTDAAKGFNIKSSTNLLKYVLPEQSLESVANILEKNPTRGTSSFMIYVAWDGPNISEIEFAVSDDFVEKYIFEYDDKLNPFRNFLNSNFEESFSEHCNFKSKNNVVSYTFIAAGDGIALSNTSFIDYTYDGRFPATRSFGNVTEYFEYE